MEFIQKIGSLAAYTALTAHLSGCGDDEVTQLSTEIMVDLSDPDFSQLQTADNWLLHPTENILLINSSGQIRAFTSVCPHAQCSRDWGYRSEVFTCACHGSQFDTAGKLISGPADQDLREFTVRQNGTELTIG